MAEEPNLDDLMELMPFARAIGLVLTEARSEEVQGYMEWAPELCTGAGILHGGALMTLADSLGAACAVLNLPPGAQTSTISSSTVFLRPVRSGRALGVARPLHAGRKVIAVRTEIQDDQGRPVAQVTQSQAVLSPPS
jgi:uncharacterized protein (TIGR00369 family)